MKKLLILCLTACVLLTACAGKQEKSLYEQGLDLISLMGEMVQSDAYFDMYAPAIQVKDTAADIADAAAAGNYQSPKAVYQISASESRLMSALGADINFDGMSAELKDYLQSQILSSCASILNSQAGTEALAASSIYMCRKSFVCSEASGNTAYLYIYEDAYPVFIVFLTGEDHAVYASGSYILSKDIMNEDNLSTLFAFAGFQIEPLEIK